MWSCLSAQRAHTHFCSLLKLKMFICCVNLPDHCVHFAYIRSYMNVQDGVEGLEFKLVLIDC